MRAGKLRHKILIETKSNSIDSYGAVTETWSTYATVWGSIEPLNGREYFEAGKVSSEVTAVIKTRYVSGVLPLMRAKFGTRIYSIVSVININELNKELQLMCKEVVG